MNHLEKLELRIAKFLRVGVVLAGVLIFAGWAWNFEWKYNPFITYKDYDPIPLIDLGTLYFQQGNYGALVSFLGLGVLISLPIIRVITTGFLFIRQKEYVLAAISGFVVTVLFFSFFLGIEL